MTNVDPAAADIVLPLPAAVAPEVADDIEKQSVFVSPEVERMVVEPDGKTVRVFLKGASDSDEARDKSIRYLEAMAKQMTGFDTKVFYENQRSDTGDYIPDANLRLVEQGWLHDYGKGQVAYSGPVLKLARLINDIAGEMYTAQLGAKDGQFPALVDAETLHKCGYFESHPNAVTLVGNMVEDFDAIEEFRAANSCSEGALLPPRDHVHIDGMCLNPAACFPCYPTMTGRTLATGECHSWLGRVFRYESRNISGLDRLYEFNVRELVFVGSDAYTRQCRETAMGIVSDLLAYFDLDAAVQTATDPFFATVSAAKKFWQQSQEVKNEILIPVAKSDGSQKILACGSINLHGNFFGNKFDIKIAEGDPAHTGCVGLGIERLVLACFSQHGLDPNRWPDTVSAKIF